MCIQATDRDHGGKVGLARCSRNKTNPIKQQHFILRHFRDIMIHGKSDCLEGTAQGVTFERCHYEQGNQYFRYEIETLHIVWGRKRNNLCIDADPHIDPDIFINFCDPKSETQKWIWGFSRISSLKNWMKHGAPVKDEHEIQDLLGNLTESVSESLESRAVDETAV